MSVYNRASNFVGILESDKPATSPLEAVISNKDSKINDNDNEGKSEDDDDFIIIFDDVEGEDEEGAVCFLEDTFLDIDQLEKTFRETKEDLIRQWEDIIMFSPEKKKTIYSRNSKTTLWRMMKKREELLQTNHSITEYFSVGKVKVNSTVLNGDMRVGVYLCIKGELFVFLGLFLSLLNKITSYCPNIFLIHIKD